MGAILSQKEGRLERVIAYASKALTVAQKKFHPMEGECYALIWGILHFRQYLHKTHFTLRTDHKPLEWLATVSDAHGRRGRWIDLLQDYNFKIVHRPGARHANADALSRNPVGQALDDEDFQQEIQDDPHTQYGEAEMTEKVLSVQHNRHLVWRGSRRQVREHTKHNRGRPGIKQWYSSDPHHLFMIDSVVVSDSGDEANPSTERLDVAEDEDLEVDQGQPEHGKNLVRYYDRKQQLELVLATQAMSKDDTHKINLTMVGDVDKGGGEMKDPDIWQDTTCLTLLREGVLPELIEPRESKRVRKRAASYCWKEQKLFFKDLYVPRPRERRSLVQEMHEDLGHSGE